MFSWIRVSSASLPFLVLLPLMCAFCALPLQAQNSEQVEVGPPPLHRVEPPSPGASAEELEKRGELERVREFLPVYHDPSRRQAVFGPGAKLATPPVIDKTAAPRALTPAG